MRQGRYRFIIGFLAVPLVLYLVYVIWPFAQAFYLAMTNKRTPSSPDRFIGFDNFKRLFESDRFWQALGHHGVLLLALPLITLTIALFLAFLLNIAGGTRSGGMTGIWGSKAYKVIFFLPQVLAVALVAVLFQAIYRPDGLGALNAVLESVGLSRVGWLLEPDLALWSIIGVMVWQAVGFYVVLFSAGMASIPAEIYESAELDGASRFRAFFSVTLPLMWDTVQVAWVYLGIAAFDAFAVVQLLSVDLGGPDGATTVLPLEIWQEAFRNSRFGYASAMGVVLFFLTLTFAVLFLRVTRRERIEY